MLTLLTAMDSKNVFTFLKNNIETPREIATILQKMIFMSSLKNYQMLAEIVLQQNINIAIKKIAKNKTVLPPARREHLEITDHERIQNLLKKTSSSDEKINQRFSPLRGMEKQFIRCLNNLLLKYITIKFINNDISEKIRIKRAIFTIIDSDEYFDKYDSFLDIIMDAVDTNRTVREISDFFSSSVDEIKTIETDVRVETPGINELLTIPINESIFDEENNNIKKITQPIKLIIRQEPKITYEIRKEEITVTENIPFLRHAEFDLKNAIEIIQKFPAAAQAEIIHWLKLA